MPLYQPLIPTGTVDLDEDYQNIQDNFNQANVVYGEDHFPFDNATVGEQGFHDKATFKARANPTSIAGQGIVYTKDSAALPGRTDLYYAYQTAGGTALTGTFFPLNIIKAFARINTTGPAIYAGSSFNVSSVVSGANTYVVTLTSAVCGAGADKDRVMVLLSWEGSTARTLIYAVDSATQITFTQNNPGITAFSFAVLVI